MSGPNPTMSSELAIKQMKSVSVADKFDNPWAKFYGEPPYISRDMLPAEGRKQTVAPDLPEAYRGDNIYIPNLIEEMVMTTDNWYTKVACPIRFTDQITWTTNVTTFDQRLPRNTPHKATSRILEHRRESRSGKLVRKGIAFEMECNFMETAEGQRHYAFTLNQMANAIITSLNIGVIMAYLTCDNYSRRYDEEHGFKFSSDVKLRTEREIFMWGIIQKEKFGMKKLDVKVTEWMTAYQGQADMWIFPPNLKMYNDLVPVENTEFWIAGPRGPQNVDDSAFPRFTLNGSMVFLCRMIDGVLEFGPRNLLARRREIGSYYTMVDKYKNASDDYWFSYKSSNRSIEAYDEDDDDWTRIDIEVANENCHVFDADGNVILPRGNRIYGDLSDRGNDMLSYDDNGERKAATLFGHIREEHFSVQSAINLAKTVAKQQSGLNNFSASEMESILVNGIQLAQKIGEQEVDMSWMFNVFMEHVISTGWDKPAGVKFADDKEWRNFVNKITIASKRSSIPMLVMRGQGGKGFTLPRYDYASTLEKASATMPVPVLLLEGEAKKQDKLGGTTRGSMAGFGNWEGYLALQAELNSGPGKVAGFTKNGYPIGDCETADRTVKLISSLAGNMQFLFENKFYLDKNRASSPIENPSVEHVIFERIMGVTGFPAYFDASSIAALFKTADAGTDGTPGNEPATSLRKQAIKFMKDGDVQNMRFLATIKEYVEKQASKDKLYKDTILKKIEFFFNPIYLEDFKTMDTLFPSSVTDRTASQGKVVSQALVGLFPLANLNPQNVSYFSLRARSIIINMIIELILNNGGLKSPKEKLDTLNGFLDVIGESTNLTQIVDAIAADGKTLSTLMGAFENLSDTADKKAVEKIFGFQKWEFNPKVYTPLNSNKIGQMMNFLEKAISKKFSGFNDKMEDYMRDLEESIAEDKRNDQSEGTRSPILRMMGLDKARFPDPSKGQKEISGESAKTGENARGFLIGGRIGEGSEEEYLAAIDKDFGPKIHPNERFFRTPLVLSAKQVEKLKSLVLTDRNTKYLMRIRVADPSNLDTFVEPGRMKGLIEKIKRINKNGSNRFGEQDLSNYRNEPSFMFYPENAKLRDFALASMPSRLEKIKNSTNKRSRNARTEAQGSNKRRRVGGKGGMRMLLGDDDEDDDMGNDERASSRGDYMRDVDDEDYESTDVSLLRRQIGVGDDDDDVITPNVVRLMIKLGDSTNKWLYKIIGKIYYSSQLNKRTLSKFIQHDILFPFSFLIFQPHKQYITYAGIKAKAGADTGTTFVGHSGLMLQNNAADKTHFGHFTTYDDTVILKNKNVYIANDIFIGGCLGGAGWIPMDPREYNISEGERGKGSVIFILSPYEENKFEAVMDITGRFESASKMTFVDQNRMDRPHYSQNWRACQTWRFRPEGQVGGEEGYREDGQAPLTNTVVVRGQQYNYDAASGKYKDKVKNLGHFGEEAPGSREGRNGGLRALVHPDYKR